MSERIEEGIRTLSADAAAFRREEGAVVLDVRGPGGKAKGAIPGAVDVERERLDELLSRESLGRIEAITSSDQEILVYCGSNNGSRPVAKWLQEHGYTNVAQIDGGFRAWEEAGLPVTGVRDAAEDEQPPTVRTDA